MPPTRPIQLVVIIFVYLKLSHTLITNQKLCPKLPNSGPQTASCDINLISWELEALAHIPGGSHSINPFHNPYGPHFSCSFFLFFCREDQLVFGDLYLTAKVRPNMVCPGLQLIQMDQRAWQVQINHNPIAKACDKAEKWTTIELVVYQQNQFIFIYGCKEHEKDNSVELGAWILVNKNATDEMKQNVLDLGLELFDKIPGIKRDWWVFPNYSTDCLTELNCSYYADCVTKNDFMEMKRDAGSETVNLSYSIIFPVVFCAVVIAIIKIVNLKKSRYQSRVVPINN